MTTVTFSGFYQSVTSLDLIKKNAVIEMFKCDLFTIIKSIKDTTLITD